MRSKNIISIIAFISAFAFSAAFASLFIDKSQAVNYNFTGYKIRGNPNCQSEKPNCREIASLLVRDNILGAERLRNYDYSLGEKGNVSAKRAATVAEYAAEASKMTDANLSPEFRTEWREHMQAWLDYANFLDEVSENKIDNADFRRLENRYLDEINDSYDDVLKLAKTYGVNNPFVY